jgi:predicted AlkP superfamily pyrophosphatase or phosphodiesterase
MLPAPSPRGPHLADVVRNLVASVRGEPDSLALPPASSAVVVLVDGLGAEPLRAAAGHARALAGAMGRRDVIESGFPTTTAAALASLTTGLPPGQHGLVGYSVLDPEHDRVVNQLSGWDERMPPERWQDQPTLFEAAAASGLRPLVAGPARYAESGFTRAVLRGAEYRGGASIPDRLAIAADAAREPGALVYVYVPELDQAGHKHGVESERWVSALEDVDAAIRDTRLPGGAGMVLTADHGMLDIPDTGKLLVDEALLRGVRHVAGEPRCLQLHLEPGVDADDIAARWRGSEGDRAWIATRAEAIEAGWFGPVRAEVAPRIGDVLVAARKRVAYYDPRRATEQGIGMIGQHGSWSPEELRVPLLRFGAYAR